MLEFSTVWLPEVEMEYDAFLSYSPASQARVATALQGALARLGKPWYRNQALRVVRDTTDLAATTELPRVIRDLLGKSRYFVLFASPAAARSPWIAQEVDAWRRGPHPRNVLIALVDGEIAWNPEAGDFDWTRSTAIPPTLQGLFEKEPDWVDFRWAEAASARLSLRNPAFLDAVTRLAAPLRGLSHEELLGEDIRQHRRTRVVMATAGIALGALAAVSIATAVVATRALRETEQRLALLKSAFPHFYLTAGAAADRQEAPALLTRTRAMLGADTGEERVRWGPDRLALKPHCEENASMRDEFRKDCPGGGKAFAREGWRTDIAGFPVMLNAIAAAAASGRLERLVGTSLQDVPGEAAAERARRLASSIEHALVSLQVLLPRPLLQKVATAREGQASGFLPGDFNLYRKPLDAAGTAELVLLRVNHARYCAAAGCDAVLLGMVLAHGRGELVFAGRAQSEFVLYNIGEGKLPQLFTAHAHARAGAGEAQGRYFARYQFDPDCVCYSRYLQGNIQATQLPLEKQGLPATLVERTSLTDPRR